MFSNDSSYNSINVHGGAVFEFTGQICGHNRNLYSVYIAEIAPPKWRGRLGSLFQLGIVSGIFATLFING